MSKDWKEDAIDIEEDADGYEDICYICKRPESKAGKMIRIPQNICICAECMQKTFDTINTSGMPYMDMMGFSPNMMNFTPPNGDIPKSQKLKKKKPKEKKEQPQLDIKNIPVPHVIKGKLDDFVVGYYLLL